MSKLDEIKSSESKSFRKLNPHIFGEGAPPYAEQEWRRAMDDMKTPPKAKKKRIRQSEKPLLNKLESEYFDKLNASREVTAQICSQAVRLRLGNGLTYSPDFFLFRRGQQVQAIEVKGKHAWDDAIAKIKMAATAYPHIKFILVWKDDQGQWQEQHVLP